MPNAIPPSPASPSAPAALPTPGGKLGKDQFLQLLTAQLRYQDPMNPLDGHQMAADLAQFSGLEQLLNINQSLDAQSAKTDTMLSAINNSVAMGTIGKTVVAADNHIVVKRDAQGVTSSSILADISTPGTAQLVIRDPAGKALTTYALGPVKTGAMQTFDLSAHVAGLNPGAYTVTLEVTDSAGKVEPQQTYYSGQVDGLAYSASGAVLTSGLVTLSLGSIRKIIG